MQLTSNGTCSPTRCQSARLNSTPIYRAIAIRCGGQLLDAPSADATTIAFSNASFVMMREGFRSSRTISTIRLPVAYAICPRSRYAAGMLAQPGSDMPSASARLFIDSAVPIVLQCPMEGDEAVVSSMKPS